MKRHPAKVITVADVKELHEDLCKLKTEYQNILDGRPAVIKFIIKSDNTMKRIDEVIAEANKIMQSSAKKKVDDDTINELSLQFNHLLKLAEAEMTSALISMREQNAKLEMHDLIVLLNEHPHEYHYLRMIGLILQKYYDEKPLLIEIAENTQDRHLIKPQITGLRCQKFE